MNGKNCRVKGCWSRGASNFTRKTVNSTPNFFSLNLNIPRNNLSSTQQNLLNYFENNYPVINKVESFSFNGNTPFSYVNLVQSDFAYGTVRITKPGIYTLQENIEFNPNESNNFFPTSVQISSGLYPQMMKGPFHLGFFAAITVESPDVIINLNGKTIKQSDKHSFQQRFFANIELASSPFIPSQGPGDFTGSTTYSPANRLLIMNGNLKQSSHHGIHGNRADNIILHNLNITNFEVAGIAINGTTNAILNNIIIKDNTKNIPLLSTYSQSIFIKKHIERLPNDANITLRGILKTKDDILTALTTELNNTFNSQFSPNGTGNLPDNIFKNPEAEKGYDGNVYGMVLNVNGVVVNDFFTTRTSSMVGNNGIYMNNITIDNISSNPIEIIGLSDTSENCVPNEAYGKNLQSGPIGDILQIQNIVDNSYNITGGYKSNILSDAQLLISKYTAGKISSAVIDWAAGANSDISATLIGVEKLYYVSGRDSMGHTMKGNIGLFISAGRNIFGENISISNIVNEKRNNFKNIQNIQPICPHIQSGRPYAQNNTLYTAVTGGNVIINGNTVSDSNRNILD